MDIDGLILKLYEKRTGSNSYLSMGFMQVRCDVTVSIAKRDEDIVRSILEKVESEHHMLTGAYCKLSLSRMYLHDKDIGGVLLVTLDSRISLWNTLRSRLVQVTERMIPLIRYGLYGFNPHRKSIN